MLDPKLVRENPEAIRQILSGRHFDISIFDSFVEQDKKWRKLLVEIEEKKASRNTLTPKGKPTEEQLSQLKALADEIKSLQEGIHLCEDNLKTLSHSIPNIFHESVPVGSSENDNVVLRKVGEIPNFSFEPKSHDVLGKKLGLDFESGAKTAGSRFVVLRSSAAKLERALINFMLDLHTTKHGYEEIMPQAIVNSYALFGTGQLPKFSADLFKIENSDYWLSPTAEVQVTNLYQDTVIQESDLPLKLTAYSPCFRSEAGSYGKDVSGLIRLHQFNKVELVRLVKPEDSIQALEELTQNAEAVLKALQLPYQVVSLCSADLGFASAKTYDLEVWFPSQQKYREISSCSTFFDFQARRAMIRYKRDSDGKTAYLHTLNGSGLAIGRTLAAIFENYQCDDGRVRVPEVLRAYYGEATYV
jgi:seryl-tRNA synthetase